MGADPDGDRGLRHLAPTYISRDTRDLSSDGHRGLASSPVAAVPSPLPVPHRQDWPHGLRFAMDAGGSEPAAKRIGFIHASSIFGRSGRPSPGEAPRSRLYPNLRERYALDFVVVNAENAAGGFGITEQILIELLDAGADVVTTGNHVFDQREALVFIERYDRLLRPINFPAGTPGKGAGLFKTANGEEVLVINAMGRVFMADLDDPVPRGGTGTRRVSAEDAAPMRSSSISMPRRPLRRRRLGYFVDGRASALIGTHTHVPTADQQILPRGTAYISDAGMCGDFNSVLGMDKEEPLQRFLTKIPSGRFTPAQGEATLCGVAIDIDDATGLGARNRAAQAGRKIVAGRAFVLARKSLSRAKLGRR